MMKQRTCSHRISELYAEIILKDRFQLAFSNQESFYYDNLFITVFRNHNFKSKLLIVDKHNQNVLFENIWNESFIIYNNLKDDLFLYSFDASDSKIYKFNNPILNNGIIKDSTHSKHSFISKFIQLRDVLIKDEVIYITGEALFGNLNKSISNFDQKIGVIDLNIFNQEYFSINFLIGVCANNVVEVKGNYFTGGNELKIWNRDINRKSTILVEYYNDEYQEYQSYLIDYSNDIVKPIHPSFLSKISDRFLVSIPYTESSHYGRYEDFKILRLNDLMEFDLSNILTEIFEEAMSTDVEISDQVFFFSSDILIIRDYEFSCSNLFENQKSSILQKEKDLQNLKSLFPIDSQYFDGYALEIHTIKSTLKPDGSFETLRTELGELIYKLKYNFDKSAIEPLASRCAYVIQKTFSNIDLIIPAPPSNLNRPFQPVYELAARVSELTKIPVDFDFIKKLPTEQIKALTNQRDRNIVLERAISIKGRKYKGKSILLFDDLFRSGDTLNAIAKKLKYEGEVNIIKVLCVTKTRTKR